VRKFTSPFEINENSNAGRKTVNRNTKGYVSDDKRRHVRLQLNIRHLIKRRQITHAWHKKTQLNAAKKLLFSAEQTMTRIKTWATGTDMGILM
jgi:hypothetical protein